MMRFAAVTVVAGSMVFALPALAAPPPNAKPLSEIIAALESTGRIAYFDEIEWENEGYWEIEYFGKDGSKTKLKIDPVTGEPWR